eukprot:CAMPEP_0184692178 /NCGR_PEP_ID=MMETSP0313-20130426/766_1 /TAXON_ID=2792 /ORGANISM="Porphyridium aerugineum, Strain SAG 1380-2" /LENGTH=261 /DNA_ID=CAMNT_0027149989 /DNA_START=76 /DNA_END=861 /DNA_ORIENTATION=+
MEFAYISLPSVAAASRVVANGSLNKSTTVSPLMRPCKSHRARLAVTAASQDDQQEINETEQQQPSLEDLGNETGDEAVDGIDAMLNSPDFLKKKIEVMQTSLAEEKAKVEKLEDSLAREKDSYIRLAADLENVRRRSAEQLADSSNRATASVLKQLLTVLDNFELADNAFKPKNDGEAAIQKSYQALNKQLLDVFVKLNVEPLDCIGKPFDPVTMEAITQQPSNEVEEGVVLYQMKRGYKLGELVVRTAYVVVSAGPGPAK